MTNKYLEKVAGISSKIVNLWDSVSRHNLDEAESVVNGVRHVIAHQAKHPERYREALDQNHRFLAAATRRLNRVRHQTKKDTLRSLTGLGAGVAGTIGGAKLYQKHEKKKELEAYDGFLNTKQAGFTGHLLRAAGEGNLSRKALNVINTARGGGVKTFWESELKTTPQKALQTEAKVVSKLPKEDQISKLINKKRLKELEGLHRDQSAARVAVAGTGAAIAAGGLKANQYYQRAKQKQQEQYLRTNYGY